MAVLISTFAHIYIFQIVTMYTCISEIFEHMKLFHTESNLGMSTVDWEITGDLVWNPGRKGFRKEKVLSGHNTIKSIL